MVQRMKQLWPLLLFLAIVVMGGIMFFGLSRQMKDMTGQMIVQDVQTLKQIFERIDESCRIAGFDYQKNPINFLTVTTFASSEIGSMNLVYPKQWRGPYIADNPSIQNIEYQVVRTDKGFFITPGDGVKLPNGKVVDTDIIFDEKADIEHMVQDEHQLMYEGKPMAAKLNLQMTALQKLLLESSMSDGDFAQHQAEEKKPIVRVALSN